MSAPLWRRLAGGARRVGGRLLPADTRRGKLARGLLGRSAAAATSSPAQPVPDSPAPRRPTTLAEIRAAGLTWPTLVPPDPEPSRLRLEALLRDPAAVLAFPHPASPAVSVIVAARHEAEAAYRCLEALLAHGGSEYELLVADCGATGRAADLLGRLRHATVVRTAEAPGPAQAFNPAARRARGRFLLLIDGDVAMTAQSMAALVGTMEGDGSCGAAGGRIVGLDGRLQEAGSIVWRDGSTEGYGRNEDPLAPEFSYAREVDSCSVAFLLVRRELFERLGGLDEGHADAVSADLGMGIRRLGYRVRYAPAAIAFRGGARAMDADASGEADAARFLQKWRPDLEEQPNGSDTPPLVARDRRAGARILVIDDRVPDASRGVGYPRAYAMLEMLASLGYRPTFYPWGDAAPYHPWLDRLQTWGVETMCSPLPFAEFAAARQGLYDAVLVSRPHNFREALPLVRRFFPGAGLVYDAEALFFHRERLKAEAEGLPWARGGPAEVEELTLMREAALVMTVSEEEKRLAIEAAPDLQGRLRVWGHPVHPRPTARPFGERKDVLFVGSFQSRPSPNEDAVRSFCHEVLPRIRSRLDCTLHVVGYGAPEALADCAGPGVTVTGRVEDLTPWYEGCRVFVVPHRYAAGIPLKLCEAMARGIPAVVSPLVATQLGVEEGGEVLVGRTEDELVARVVELHENERRWSDLRQRGLAFVAARHDPAALEAALRAIVEESIAGARTEARRT